jgi:hypothetical protein
VRAQEEDYSSGLRKLAADQSYNKLLHAEIFNLGGIGWARTMTTEEEAFRKLLVESQNPLASFKRLLSEANPEGQLYALYGLYLQDRNAFREEALRLKIEDGPPERREKFISVEKGKVRVGLGCLLFQQDRRAVIEKMAEGKFDQTFKASGLVLKH